MRRKSLTETCVVLYLQGSEASPRCVSIGKKKWIVKYLDRYQDQGAQWQEFPNEFAAQDFLSEKRKKFYEWRTHNKHIAHNSEVETLPVHRLLALDTFSRYKVSPPLHTPVPKTLDIILSPRSAKDGTTHYSAVHNNFVYFQSTVDNTSKYTYMHYFKSICYLLLDSYFKKVRVVNVRSNISHETMVKQGVPVGQSSSQVSKGYCYYFAMKNLEGRFKEVNYLAVKKKRGKKGEESGEGEGEGTGGDIGVDGGGSEGNVEGDGGGQRQGEGQECEKSGQK